MRINSFTFIIFYIQYFFIYYRQDGQGNTPLHLALSQEKANNCTQILCDENISAYNWNLQDAFGRSALHWICSKGYFGLLTQLTNLNTDKINKHNDKNGYGLGSLADDDEEEEKKKKNDDNKNVKKKYDIFASFNLQNKSGQTCLHWAVDKKEWYFYFFFSVLCARII